MTATRAAVAPPDRRGAEADTGAVGRWRAVRRAALAAGLVAALAAPAAVSAAPRRAAAQLKAASAPASELSQVASIPLPGGATVYRFQQRISGVKVLNGQAVVDDPAGAPPDLVADSSKPGIDAPPAARVEKPPRAPDRISRRGRAGVCVPTRRRAWRLHPATAEGSSGASSSHPPGRWRDFEVLVDAVSGRVVHTRDLLQHFSHGHAKLYDPNPVAERHSFFGGLRSDHKDRNTRLLTSLRIPVRLPHIRGGQDCLRGRWVHAKVGRHPAHEVCKASLRWNSVKRSKDRFEGLMAYFHVDRAETLHPEPRIRRRPRERDRRPRPGRGRGRVQRRQLLLLRRRLGRSSTEAVASTTPRTPTSSCTSTATPSRTTRSPASGPAIRRDRSARASATSGRP